jgi:hypothetical protein
MLFTTPSHLVDSPASRGNHAGRLGFRGGAAALLLLAAGGLGLRLALFRATAPLPSPWMRAALVAAAAICAAAVLAAIVRILRADSWVHYPAAAFLLVLLFVRARYPIGMAELLPAIALFFLAPAGLLVWKFAATLRGADELQRRILFESFAASFVVLLVALMTGAVLSDAGWSRPHPVWWAGLLVSSWSIALVLANRRYDPS